MKNDIYNNFNNINNNSIINNIHNFGINNINSRSFYQNNLNFNNNMINNNASDPLYNNINHQSETNNINQNMIQNFPNINKKYSFKLIKLNNNIVDLYDCFEYFQKTELFDGENQIYCNNCHILANSNFISTLATSPKILIIILNRGRGNIFKIKLEFSTEIDILNYIEKNTGGCKYKLISVIANLEESGQSEHFIAHCLSPIDNQWYSYNDDIVSKIDDIQKQIIEPGMPRILFYKKIEENI